MLFRDKILKMEGWSRQSQMTFADWSDQSDFNRALNSFLLMCKWQNNLYYINKNMSQQSEEENSKGDKWPFQLHFRYFLFNILHYDKSKHEHNHYKKRKKFFVQMSDWLCKMKTPAQCRTHHSKCLKKHGDSIHILLKYFIEIHYTIRRINISYLRDQMEFYLNVLLSRKAILIEQKKLHLETTQKFITSSCFELYKYSKELGESGKENKEQKPQVESPAEQQRGELHKQENQGSHEMQNNQINPTNINNNLPLFIETYVEPDDFMNLES